MALTPELHALMATVRDDLPRLNDALAHGVNWDVLTTLVVREHATIALNRCMSRLLEQAEPPEVDAATLAGLAAGALRHELRLVAQSKALDALLSVLRDAGLTVVLLKGLAFQRAYCDSALDRPSGDMDILLSVTEAERAWRLAQENGWKRDESFPSERYTSHHHLPPLVDKFGLRLEIHTALVPEPNPFGLDADTVRRNAQQLPGSPGVYIPRAEDLLLHASIHFAWSNMLKSGAWKTFRDIHVVVQRGRMDWDQLVEATRHSSSSAAMFWTLHFANSWAGVAVPEQILSSLMPRGFGPMRNALERHFITAFMPAPGQCAPGRSVWVDHKLFELAMRPKGQTEPWTPPWSIHWLDPVDSTQKGPMPASRPHARRGQVRRAIREMNYLLRLFTDG